VVTTITPIERNRVNVTFTMTEGDAARIKDIRIVGSQGLLRVTLLGLFDLTPGGWLTWYTKSDRYSRAKLNADLETLRATTSTAATSSSRSSRRRSRSRPTSRTISITISVKEGQPYTVTAVRLEGDYLGKEDEFKSLVLLRPGQPYRGEAVTETSQGRFRPVRPYGYAFARVEPRPEIDRAKGQVAVVWWPSRSAASTCAASTWRATRARATRSCGASSASSSRPGTTATASSCRATVSTAWATSRTSTSTPTKWPARPIRSTWWSTSPRSPPATC
jgi:hypothetical protein